MWFRRLLLSYLPVFFIVTMILFVVFFQTLNEQNRREAIKANEFLAQQVIHFMDTSLRDIDYRVVREILTNADVKRFFSRNGVDVYANIQSLKVIDDLKFSYPIIDSIYFVRFSDGFVFGDSSRTAGVFQDEPFIDGYAASGTTAKWTGERSFKGYSLSESESVITLVKEAPYNMSSKQGYFVVNVSLAKLQEMVGRMYNPDITFVNIIDGAGRNLLGEESGGSAGERPGAVLSSFTSPYTGWEISSGPVDKNGMKLALTFYNVWVVLAFAAAAFGILWVIYITKRNYKPIQQIVSLIETYAVKGKGPDRPEEGEFGFIQNTLENLMSETKQFQQKYREKLILQKKYHFHQVLEGSAQLGEQEWISELRGYDLDVEGKTAAVYVMEIDSYTAFTEAYNQRDQSLLKFTLYSIIHETAKNSGAAVWAEWTTDCRVSFILWVDSEGEAAGQSLEIVDACREWIEQNVRFNITAGQGGTAETLEELRQSYELANHCLQFKAVLGANRIITVQDTVRPQQEMQEYFKTIDMLSQSLRLADPEWKPQLCAFIGQMRDSLLPRKEIESLISFFIHHLEGELMELSKEYRSCWREAQDGLQRLEKRWDTVDELQEECIRIFEAMTGQMNQLRDSHSSKALIMDIRSFIEENYSNSELSLEFLSSRFELNAKYLSKMFKEEFGENFVDFLIGLRISSAKKLLLETQKPMQAISSEVGYYNYNSFNRAFKNVVGLSPRDFRKQLGIGG
ncbi:helix-turn-helix domain-containing protein [Paenibacillus vietnamensis]|uniref:helix-turn-helix domain-containing protein n=1 Tax=Paenibacillus vietnamensis TaxID=2590547 RepID=UPI001CD16A66|nr:helix-turn-helix domain-containing protein [Paenibacillus vietnamensis]